MTTQRTVPQGRSKTTQARAFETQSRTPNQEKKHVTVSWNDITGIMTVWGKEVGKGNNTFISYHTSVGRKNEDGEYDNLYYNVRFAKDIDPELLGQFKIIAKGFLTLDIAKDGKKYPAVYITSFVFCEPELSEEIGVVPFK